MDFHCACHFAADRSSVGLQLPLDLNNEFDYEFNNMVSSVETVPTLVQDPFQQSSFIKPSFPPTIDNDDLVEPKGDKLSKQSRANKIKNSQACIHCQKSKVKCNYLDNNNPCKRCAERGFECTFYPQQRRGPKPGKKTRLGTQNLEDFRKLNRDFTRKAHKLGFSVHTHIVAYPNNNLDTPILNYNATLPMEENLFMVNPESAVHPPPLSRSSFNDCEDSNSSISILDNHRFFMNNEIETDPRLALPYHSSHQN
ncbi:2144_t:CDS:1 [Dentiscutata erythropus]|uniref:2144_t:CDS:1 n=1 Tax=Dentiscutata erythropus TaxID=1348616 RepID=A0A9N8WJD4_9GLOM|nr:2144_t:CDS:1 [Dentiscutata erythropus]